MSALDAVPTGPQWTQIMRIQVEQHPTDHGMPRSRRLPFRWAPGRCPGNTRSVVRTWLPLHQGPGPRWFV